MNRTFTALTIASLVALASANSFAADGKIALSTPGTQATTPVAAQGQKATEAAIAAPQTKSDFDPQINVRVGNSYPTPSF